MVKASKHSIFFEELNFVNRQHLLNRKNQRTNRESSQVKEKLNRDPELQGFIDGQGRAGSSQSLPSGSEKKEHKDKI